MARISRTMLAVIAAIQSGAHTRRKPKYIAERAMFSDNYPTSTAETLGNVGFNTDSISVIKARVDSSLNDNMPSTAMIVSGINLELYEAEKYVDVPPEVINGIGMRTLSIQIKASKINWDMDADYVGRTEFNILSMNVKKVKVTDSLVEQAGAEFSVMSIQLLSE